MRKIKSDFFSKGIRCDGDLYLPENVKKPPVVIMAHGLSAVKAFRLPAFAERFVEKGMATFLFDYRTFGQSDGEPRHVVNPFHHVQDWLAAIAHVRNLTEIDSSRIALWGTSFSGGHVIIAAAKDAGIKAVVSQRIFIDPSEKCSGHHSCDMLWHGGLCKDGVCAAAALFSGDCASGNVCGHEYQGMLSRISIHHS